MEKFKNYLIVAIITATICLLFIPSCLKNSITRITMDDIKVQVTKDKGLVLDIKKLIVKNENLSDSLKAETKKAKRELQKAVESKDTLAIIATQDTVIRNLDKEVDVLEAGSILKDSVITVQDEIITSLEKGVDILEKDNKDLVKENKKAKFKVKVVAIGSAILVALILIVKK